MIPTRPDDFPSPESSRVTAVRAQPVTLADGHVWGLARPTPRYRPEAVPGVDEPGRPAGATGLGSRIGYPAAIERLVDALRVACLTPRGPATDARRYEALMALAVALLRRAHDLEPTAAAALLLGLDEAGLVALVDEVLALAGGITYPPDPRSAPSSRGGGDA